MLKVARRTDQPDRDRFRRLLRRKHVLYGVLISAILLVSSISLTAVSPYRAHDGPTRYYRARVVSVQSVSSADSGPSQRVRVVLLDGPAAGSTVSIERVDTFGDAAYKRLPTGSQVLLSKDAKSSNQYGLVGRWYMPGIATLFSILLVLVILIGAWRGITSVFGLAVSIFILAAYVVPRITAGHDAFVTCVIAAFLITLTSIFIAHGFNKRSSVAFVSSLMALLLVIGLTGLATYLTGVSEIIGEDNIGIVYATHPIDLAGLLTGGVIIASLGTLFDITTGQAAAVDEIYQADRRQSTGQLFKRGLSVGREHIAALINTLALVYAGVALPAIITTAVYAQTAAYAHTPLIVRLNTETIAEEVVRTCVASIGMLLALPIATYLAAYVLPRWTPAVDTAIKNG